MREFFKGVQKIVSGWCQKTFIVAGLTFFYLFLFGLKTKNNEGGPKKCFRGRNIFVKGDGGDLWIQLDNKIILKYLRGRRGFSSFKN